MSCTLMLRSMQKVAAGQALLAARRLQPAQVASLSTSRLLRGDWMHRRLASRLAFEGNWAVILIQISTDAQRGCSARSTSGWT